MKRSHKEMFQEGVAELWKLNAKLVQETDARAHKDIARLKRLVVADISSHIERQKKRMLDLHYRLENVLQTSVWVNEALYTQRNGGKRMQSELNRLPHYIDVRFSSATDDLLDQMKSIKYVPVGTGKAKMTTAPFYVHEHIMSLHVERVFGDAVSLKFTNSNYDRRARFTLNTEKRAEWKVAVPNPVGQVIQDAFDLDRLQLRLDTHNAVAQGMWNTIDQRQDQKEITRLVVSMLGFEKEQ